MQSFEEIMAALAAEEVVPEHKAYSATAEGPVAYQASWDKLYNEKHGGETGGPYSGRNNAMVRLVALLKAKRTPFLPSHNIVSAWNSTNCVPPLSLEEFEHTFSKLWKNFAMGAEEILDQNLSGDWEVLGVENLLDLADNFPGIPWLVEGFIKEAGLHIIAAPAAGAKSWSMMDLARCFLTGEQWFGREVAQRPVFYIDEEMGSVLFADRLKKLNYDRAIKGLSYIGRQGFVITNAQHLSRLVEWCNQNPGGVVFADTLVAISDMDENSNSEVRKLRPLFNAVMNTGATLIVAHHVKKGGVKEGSMVEHEVLRGAADLAAMVDMAYLLNKQEGFTQLKVVKNRLTSEEEGIDINFKLEDYFPNCTDKRVRLVQLGQEERNFEEFDRKVAAIMECLSPVIWKSSAEIVEHTGLSSGAVATALVQMSLRDMIDSKRVNGTAMFQIMSLKPQEEQAKDE